MRLLCFLAFRWVCSVTLPEWSLPAAQLESQGIGNGLTRYIYGNYASEAKAAEALNGIIRTVPDAFILSRTGAIQTKAQRVPAQRPSSPTPPEH